jgi:hypothetical protein
MNLLVAVTILSEVSENIHFSMEAVLVQCVIQRCVIDVHRCLFVDGCRRIILSLVQTLKFVMLFGLTAG